MLKNEILEESTNKDINHDDQMKKVHYNSKKGKDVHKVFSKLMLRCAIVGKVNQMRSPDLDFRLKIRILDLEGLRCFESKTFEVKFVETMV